MLEHFHKHLRCGAAAFLTWAFHRARGEQPKVMLHEGKSGGVLIGVPQTEEQGRHDSGCRRKDSVMPALQRSTQEAAVARDSSAEEDG
jgi:hypothetical protein